MTHVDLLARLGFREPAAALRHLPADIDSDSRWLKLLESLGRTPQPDEALVRLGRIDEGVRDQILDGNLDLAALLGFGEWFVSMIAAVNTSEIKTLRDRELCRIGARDLRTRADRESFEKTGMELADLADECVRESLGSTQGIAVIAMGKYGGRELNYASDIDVLFVCADERHINEATSAAQLVMQTMNGPPVIFRCDADLRPEGKDGPLVRTLGAYEEYFKRWAKAWEFQALIKARFAAGDEQLGTQFLETVAQHLWQRPLAGDALEEIRRLKARNESRIEREQLANRQVKLGRGGIRDVEFALQILQLVHGRHHAELRVASTLDALDQLVAVGLLSEPDGSRLADAYVVLRHIEHRLQMLEGRQTHTLPTEPVKRELIARGLGLRNDSTSTALKKFEDQWRETTAAVRAVHETLFYRPLLEAFVSADTLSLDAADLDDRIRTIGFDRPTLSRKAIKSLTEGSGRTPKIMKALLPAMLGWIAQTPEPDQGLVRLATLAESLKPYPHLVAQLRDRPHSALAVSRALGSSALLASLLDKDPQILSALADGARLSRAHAVSAALGASLRFDEAQEFLRALRRFVDGNRLRIASLALGGGGPTDAPEESTELTSVSEGFLETIVARAREDVEAVGAFSVVGMGRLAGRELSFASDLDVMFVFDTDTDPQRFELVAERIMKLASATPPIYKLDAELRPEGKKGPLARSLAAFLAYWERWAEPWEFQALLRARHVAGDASLSERFLASAARNVYLPTFGSDQVSSIRKMKARIASERASTRTDPRYDMKVCPGGLADIEFTVQMLQLRYGYSYPQLRTASTLKALDAATDCGVLEDDDRDTLATTYATLTRFRNRLFLIKGLPTDVMPEGGELAESLARTVGYVRGSRDRVVAEYLRVTRKASTVTEKLFDREI